MSDHYYTRVLYGPDVCGWCAKAERRDQYQDEECPYCGALWEATHDAETRRPIAESGAETSDEKHPK